MKTIVSWLPFKNLTRNSFLFLLLSSFFSFLSADYSVVEDLFKEKVLTPSMQGIERKKIRLTNGLEAYLISDPEAPRSAAALSVGVGWSEDPKNAVGMAHFVEHMLFLGTEEYPEEGEYGDFIKNHGGYSNAYTGMTKTVYMFKINNPQFEEALHRFSRFFVHPLFTPSALGREKNAVNEEFVSRLNNDDIRQFLVQSSLGNGMWGCGNSETLADVQREELIRWYREHYSANLMKLSVYSSLPMEELIRQVDADFSSVPDHRVEIPLLEVPAVKSEYLGKEIRIESIRDLKRLTMVWEVPSEFAGDEDHHTLSFLAYVLNQEAPGSPASYLKEQGLINGIDCSGETVDDQLAYFVMSLELTPSGMEQKDRVIDVCFQALHSLKKGIPPYLFREMVEMAKTKYRYQTRKDPMKVVTFHAAHLQEEALAGYPEKTLWPRSYDSEKMKRLLKCLKADRCVYYVMAPSAILGEEPLDRREDYQRVSYGLRDISRKNLQHWENGKITHSFLLPKENPYIPDDLESVVTTEEREPKIISSTPKSEIYYLGDTEFRSPESYYDFYIKTPSLDPTPLNEVLSDLEEFSFYEASTPLRIQGGIAGLYGNIHKNKNFGWRITVNGYSQKSADFLGSFLEVFLTHKTDRASFNRYKEYLLRDYHNRELEGSYQVGMQLLAGILYKNNVSYAEKMKVLESVAYEDFRDYISSRFEEVYVRGMIYGNVTEKGAGEVVASVLQKFENIPPYPPEHQIGEMVLDMNKEKTPRCISTRTVLDGNATILLIGEGEADFRKTGLQQLLSSALENPFFENLRTKQQTGYIVYTMGQEVENKLFNYFLVQSNTCTPEDLLTRFESFNEAFLSSLNTEGFSSEKFERIKESALVTLRKPLNNIREAGQRWSALAFQYEGDFKRLSKRIKAMQDISFEDFINYSQEYLGRGNPMRIAVFVNGRSEAPESAGPLPVDYVPIENLSVFKSENDYTALKSGSGK